MALHFKCTTSLHFLRVPQFLLSDPSPTLRSRLRHSENSFPQTMLGPIGALQAARKLLKSQQKYALSCLLSASNIKDFGPLKLTKGGIPIIVCLSLKKQKKLFVPSFEPTYFESYDMISSLPSFQLIGWWLVRSWKRRWKS